MPGQLRRRDVPSTDHAVLQSGADRPMQRHPARRVDPVEDRLPEQVVTEAQPVAGGREDRRVDRGTHRDGHAEGGDAQRAGDDVGEQLGADDRSDLEDGLGWGREPPDAPLDGVADGDGNVLDPPGRSAGEQGELTHEERVATGAAVDDLGRRPVDWAPRDALDQRVHRRAVESLDLDVLPMADHIRETLPHRPGELVVPVGADEAHTRRVGVSGYAVEECEGRLVGPLEVVENHHHWSLGGHRVEPPRRRVHEQQPGAPPTSMQVPHPIRAPCSLDAAARTSDVLPIPAWPATSTVTRSPALERS